MCTHVWIAVTVSPVKDLTAVGLYGPFNVSCYYCCYFVLGMWWRQTSDGEGVSNPRLRRLSSTFRHVTYAFLTDRVPFWWYLLEEHICLDLFWFFLWSNESLFKTICTCSTSAITNRQTVTIGRKEQGLWFFYQYIEHAVFFFFCTHKIHV